MKIHKKRKFATQLEKTMVYHFQLYNAINKSFVSDKQSVMLE